LRWRMGKFVIYNDNTIWIYPTIKEKAYRGIIVMTPAILQIMRPLQGNCNYPFIHIYNNESATRFVTPLLKRKVSSTGAEACRAYIIVSNRNIHYPIFPGEETII
jgi:hypothetical protein